MKILTQGPTVSLACYVQLCRSTWPQECMLWMKGFSCDFILWRVLERYPSLVSLSYHDVCSIRPFVVVYIVLPKSCITFYQKCQKQYQRWIITIIFVYSLRPKQMTTLGLNPIEYFFMPQYIALNTECLWTEWLSHLTSPFKIIPGDAFYIIV